MHILYYIINGQRNMSGKKAVKKGGEKGKIKKKKLIGALMVSRSKFFGP